MFRLLCVRSGVATIANVSLAFWCLTLAACVFAQSETRHAKPSFRLLVAEPKPQGANPFLPSANRDERLPVMLDGFCLVTLREQQEWLLGSESNQLVFDGRLYWFAGQRQRAMFAASPLRYVPALGGHCVVTFAESGARKHGNPQYGILHNQRLFFFRGLTEQEKFLSDPDKFANIDLANGGRCLVSQLDDERILPGLPETTVVIDRLRYQFVSEHQQRKFLVNLSNYGVAKPKRDSSEQTPHAPVRNAPSQQKPEGSFSLNTEVKKSKTPVTPLIAEVANKAMSGYCPVTIREKGTWVIGEARYRVEFDGLTYLMVGEAEQKLFAENPSTYLPVLGGHCVVTEIDENRRVPGSIYHAMWHEGESRLFLFAGDKQKKAFEANPAKYLHADLVADGNCIVTLIDEGKKIAGLPELLLWHQGKRYLFASKEQQAIFLDNIQRYQDR